jgi:hypothetical protein
MEFVVNALKQDPAISYRSVADAGRERGFHIPPVTYGRAKALLGLVPMTPRGQGKTAAVAREEEAAEPEAEPAAPPPTPRLVQVESAPRRVPPPPPPRQRIPNADIEKMLLQLDSFHKAMREFIARSERQHEALKQIADVARDALED